MLRRRRRRRRRVHRPSSSSQRPSASHSLLSSLFSLQASDDTITSPNHVLVLVHGASSEVTERAKESEAFLPLFFETDEFNRLEFVSPFSSPSLERKTLSLSLCVCVCVCVCSDIRRDLLTQSRRAWRDVQKFLGAVSEKEREKQKKKKKNKQALIPAASSFLPLSLPKGKKNLLYTPLSSPRQTHRGKTLSRSPRSLSIATHCVQKRKTHK